MASAVLECIPFPSVCRRFQDVLPIISFAQMLMCKETSNGTPGL